MNVTELRRPVLALALILIPAALSAADAPRIDNSATPAHGTVTVQLEELWRAGGPDDDENLFGQIIRVRGDADDNVYVLDGQLQQVSMFEPRGSLAGLLFGQGEGPGEVRRSRDLLLCPNGDVGVVSRFPGALVRVHRDGTPADALRLNEPGRGFESAVWNGGNLVTAQRLSVTHDDGTHTDRSLLCSLSPDGSTLATYVEHDRHVDYQNNYTFNERDALLDFMHAFDVGPDGRVYVIPDADEYAVSVFAPDGTLERVITRAWEPMLRTDTERERVEALAERRFRTFPFDISFEYADHEAVSPWFVRGVQVADDGRLWVRTSLPGGGAVVLMDVFDPAGRFERQVAIPVSGNRGATSGVFLVGDDRLVVVTGFVDAMRSVFGGGPGALGDPEADPTEIICYRFELD